MTNDIASFVNSIPIDGIISLDIFDTAITRRVARPLHIFAIMQETLLSKYGSRFDGGIFRRFINERWLAERDSRNNGASALEETSLDLIYQRMAEKNTSLRPLIEEIKILEIETELKECIAIPEIQTAYKNALEKGIAVVFASDMYLPISVIEKMLQKCGYVNYRKIYLSSELQATKSTGTLWDVILKDIYGENKFPFLKTTNSQVKIYHIGDNINSDVKQAQKKGICTMHFEKYSKVQKEYGNFSNAILPLSRLTVKERMSFPIPANHSFSINKTLYTIARTHLPLLYGCFVKWIDDQARQYHVKTVHFLSRDGWILKKTWEMLADMNLVSRDYAIRYTEVSRKALMLPAILKVNRDSLYFMRTGGEKGRPACVYLERLGIKITSKEKKRVLKYFSSLEEPISEPWSSEALEKTFYEFEKEIVAVASEKRIKAIAYLKNAGFFDEGKKAIVDLGWHGNMQLALKDLLELEGPYSKDIIVGFYVGLLRDAQKNTYRLGSMHGMCFSEFRPQHEVRTMYSMIQLLELLHLAPHGSVSEYAIAQDKSGNDTCIPVYGENKQVEHMYEKCIGPMQEIALETLRSELENKTIDWNSLTPQTYWETFLDLAKYPSEEEVTALGQFIHLDGFDHAGNGVHLVSNTIPKNFAEATALIENGNSPWISGTLISWILQKVLKPEDMRRLINKYSYIGFHWQEYLSQLISKNYN